MTRAARKQALGVSLFPFLAVLLCTMGALIVLLVVIARNSRLQAAATAEKPPPARRADDLQADRELIEVRISQLRESRDKTAAQLEEERLRLSSVEDHLRRLREQLSQMTKAAADLANTAEPNEAQRQAAAEELARLQAAIAQAQAELDAARRQAQNGPTSYAILPYEGPNKTRRRPLYVECRGDAIVLQPEGIALSERDFPEPAWSGNPLAAALRAAREYIAQTDPASIEKTGEPYPLILVRPDGIAAYYVAREAMSSWGADFGYELVGQDWQLEFPVPDNQLAQVEQRAVDESRARQQFAPRAVRQRPGGDERPAYRVAPSGGGLVRDSGPTLGDLNKPTTDDMFRKNGAAQRESATGPELGGQAAPTLGGESSQSADGSPPNAAKKKSLADTRGKNWALGDPGPKNVPVTRPIRMECRGDRLTILGESGGHGERVIAFAARTEDSIDEIVSAVRSAVKTWGIAGKGMYWRPQLILELGASGEGRFAEIEALLADSGFDIKRK